MNFMTAFGLATAGITFAVGVVAGTIEVDERYAHRSKVTLELDEVRGQVAGIVDQLRLDTLERRLDDYRRDGTCAKTPHVCRDLERDIEKIKTRG